LSESETSGVTPPFLAGGGDAAALIGRLNRDNCPLGPPDAWSQALANAIGLMLPAQLSIGAV
jgi:hypothetical protein